MISFPGVLVNTSATPPGNMYKCLGVRPARLTIGDSPCDQEGYKEKRPDGINKELTLPWSNHPSVLCTRPVHRLTIP